MTLIVWLIVIRRTRIEVGVYSAATVSITECDLRPAPVDIPVSPHCVPEHSWNSLCSVYLGKTVHRLKTKKQNQLYPLLPIPSRRRRQIIRLDLHQNEAPASYSPLVRTLESGALARSAL